MWWRQSGHGILPIRPEGTRFPCQTAEDCDGGGQLGSSQVPGSGIVRSSTQLPARVLAAGQKMRVVLGEQRRAAAHASPLIAGQASGH
jgi:hypothetical protein